MGVIFLGSMRVKGFTYVFTRLFNKFDTCRLGPCKGRSRDSGIKFQTDHGFWIQISKRARHKIQISTLAP